MNSSAICQEWIDSLPSTEGYLKNEQSIGREFLLEKGMPSKKDEAWRLSNFNKLNSFLSLPTIIHSEDIKSIFPEKDENRARIGIFLGFQYPVEIPGVSNLEFLRVATNSRRKELLKSELDTFQFEDLVKERLKIVEMDPAFLQRSVNEGFSGGEKKRNEILQMALLEPVISILDETDSGLDIDALRIVASGINRLSQPNSATILITHYQRLLNEITPDFVHIMADGKIIKTGNKELAIDLEKSGYDFIDKNSKEKEMAK